MSLELSSPFPPESIHWRAQALTKDKKRALALAYLNARDVMDRFDMVCGAFGWQDSYTETASGRVICTISVRDEDGNWISKSDGAGKTAVEGDKGGISDAFKRAAVKWGVGRYLYDLSDVWAPCTLYNDKWDGWTREAEDMFRRALARVAGEPAAPVQTITQEQADELTLMANQMNVLFGPLLKQLGISDIRKIPAADNGFDRAKAWVTATAEKNAKEAA